MGKPRFNYRAMREFFYAWHGGQDSPLYAAASSGLVGDVDALVRELRGNAEWCEKNKGVQVETAKDARYSRRIADALPLILSAPFVHSYDRREYRAFPWAGDQS